VERHIEKHGIDDFYNSTLVRTERKSRFSQMADPNAKIKKEVNKKPLSVIFDINKSNMVLLDKKPIETIKVLGKVIRI
jgi:hypothetical protein